MFKARLDESLSDMEGVEGVPAHGRGVGARPPSTSLPTNPFCDSMMHQVAQGLVQPSSESSER